MLLLPLTLATAVVSSIHKAGSRTRQAASALVHHSHHAAAAAPADVPPPLPARAAGAGPAGRRMSMEARRRRSSVDGTGAGSTGSLRYVPAGGAPRQAALQRRASTGGAPAPRGRWQQGGGDRLDGPRRRSSLDRGVGGGPRSSAAAAAAAAAPRRRSSLGGSSVDSGRRASVDSSRAAAADSVDLMMDPPALSPMRSAW